MVYAYELVVPSDADYLQRREHEAKHLQSDNVFRNDGGIYQLATMTGSSSTATRPGSM